MKNKFVIVCLIIIKRKKELSEQINVLNKKVTVIEDNIGKYEECNLIYNSEYAKLIEKYLDKQLLLFEMVDALIEKILVDEQHNIKIYFKFQEEISKISKIELI